MSLYSLHELIQVTKTTRASDDMRPALAMTITATLRKSASAEHRTIKKSPTSYRLERIEQQSKMCMLAYLV